MEMKLTYIDIHAANPEKMRDFYVKYLGAVADDLRPIGSEAQEEDAGGADRGVSGTVYSLSFEGGVKIRLIPELPVISPAASALSAALSNISSAGSAMQVLPSYAVRLTFTVGSRKRVNELTGQLIMEGYDVIYEPGFYGMEHYSSSVFDPEGNVVELVA